MIVLDVCSECGKPDQRSESESGEHVCDECIDKYCEKLEQEWKKKLH